MIEEKVGQGFGLLQALLEGGTAFLADQSVRVLAFGQEEEADLLLARRQGQAGFQGLPGGVSSGLIAIEAEDQFRRLGEEVSQVIRCGSRAQGRHGIVDAELGQGNDVHITLHDQQSLGCALGLKGLVEAVEFPALVEEGGLGGVEVFRFAVTEEAAAKADDSTSPVPDREEDAVAEAVVVLAVLLDHQAGLDQVPQVLFGTT